MSNDKDQALPATGSDAAEPAKGPPGRIATMLRLKGLLLDKDNPRFGGMTAGGNSQTNILDHIVTTFGVGDVLSSLAVNGYFKAEPLVGRGQENSNEAVIVEGNRRLAACLILVGDDRAKNQKALTDQAQKTWAAHGSPLQTSAGLSRAD